MEAGKDGAANAAALLASLRSLGAGPQGSGLHPPVLRAADPFAPVQRALPTTSCDSGAPGDAIVSDRPRRDAGAGGGAPARGGPWTTVRSTRWRGGASTLLGDVGTVERPAQPQRLRAAAHRHPRPRPPGRRSPARAPRPRHRRAAAGHRACRPTRSARHRWSSASSPRSGASPPSRLPSRTARRPSGASPWPFPPVFPRGCGARRRPDRRRAVPAADPRPGVRGAGQPGRTGGGLAQPHRRRLHQGLCGRHPGRAPTSTPTGRCSPSRARCPTVSTSTSSTPRRASTWAGRASSPAAPGLDQVHTVTEDIFVRVRPDTRPALHVHVGEWERSRCRWATPGPRR